jgi:hypothetical protein
MAQIKRAAPAKCDPNTLEDSVGEDTKSSFSVAVKKQASHLNVDEPNGPGNGKGFIAMYRSVMDHWIWEKGRARTKTEAWLYLLLSARYSNSKDAVGYSLISLQSGQLLTSQKKLSEDWRWGREAVRSFLKMLEDDQMITIKTTKKYTIITICNYDSYQGRKPTNLHQKTNKPTSTRHQPDTYNKENNVNNENNGSIAAGDKSPQPRCYKNWSEEDFKNEVNQFKGIYPDEMLTAFFEWFKEKSPRGKMRFQSEKAWETGLRLNAWQRRNFDNKAENRKGYQATSQKPAPSLWERAEKNSKTQSVCETLK